ncbi:MAG: diguanylate cyclase [Propionivibrio sp.]
MSILPEISTTLVAPRGRRRFVWLSLLLVILWAVAAHLAVEALTRERSSRLVEKEQDTVAAIAANIGSKVGFSLAYLRSIPKVLARHPEIESALAAYGPDVQPSALPTPVFRQALESDSRLSGLVSRLEAVLADLDIDQIWVVNAAGDCVVSAGFSPESSATGVNYADRDYFRLARREGEGRQFAVGRTSNMPGIFYSAAVLRNGAFLGSVVVKIDGTRLSRMMTERTSFVTDEYGVIIISGDETLRMKTVPQATVMRLAPAERLSRYSRDQFETVDIRPEKVGELMLQHFPGQEFPMVSAVYDHQTDILKIWVFRGVAELSSLRHEGIWLFTVLLLGGGLLIASAMAAVVHFLQGRAQRAEIARVNAELVNLNEELRIQARFDALTGLANRRHFLERLDGELHRSARFGLPCSLAILDIDHFKSVNDQFGHAAGDAVLRTFAQTLGQCVRNSDLAARFGGEEFAVLMPQTSVDGATELAERIRGAVQDASVSSGESILRVSVSIGVAQWSGETPEQLIARADDAMYAAKSAGRNQVCASPPRA